MNALRRPAIVVVLVLAVILAWLILDQTQGTNPVRDTATRVLAPIQYVLQQVFRPVRAFVSNLGDVGQLQQDKTALEKENAALKSEIVLLREAAIENESLRRQLSFKSSAPSFQLLSAEVIGRDPNNLLQYLIIDRGGSDLVQVGMPVLAAEGLVGRIAEVSTSSAKVMLITDPSSSVSALIQRSRATGMVQGAPGDELTMRYILQGDTVAPGDLILTSGLGDNFPKRLVIGQVASIRQKDVEMFQEAQLVPAVNLRDLESVMVLLSFTAGDLTQE